MGKHSLDNRRKTAYGRDTKIRKSRGSRSNSKRRKRDVISYENVPIDEYKEYTEDKIGINKKLVKRAVIVFGIIAVLVLSVFLVVNKEKLTWDNISMWFSENILGSDGNGYPADIVGTKVSKGNLALVGGRLCYASDTSYVELDDSAAEVINSQLSYSNPIIRGTRNYSIVYGAGGEEYMIHDTKKLIYKGTTEGGILTADVNDSGSYVIVTTDSDYLSVLTAFDDNHKKIYEYSFADYYITCAAVNSSGSGAVCCGITTVDGSEQIRVYFLDFKEAKPLMEYEITDCMIYDFFYQSPDTVSAVANDGVYRFDLEDGKPKKEAYNSRSLTTYCYNSDTKTFAIALSRSGDGRNCDIISFNSYGEKEYTISSKYKVDSISLYKGALGILSGETAYILNEDGSVDSKSNAGNDAQAILLDGTDSGYVLGISEVRSIEFK